MPDAYEFNDIEALLDYINESLFKASEEFTTILHDGMEEPDDTQAHFLLPLQFDANLWTKLVWDHWEKISDQELEDGKDPCLKVTDIMTTYFNGLAEAVATGQFSPEHSALPINKEESEPFDYYDGLQELDGWKNFESLCKSYGLQLFPFLVPMIEEERFGIGLRIHSGTDIPLKMFIETGTAVPGMKPS